MLIAKAFSNQCPVIDYYTMNKEIIDQIRQVVPDVIDWIDNYLNLTADQSVLVSELGFQKLNRYFPENRLQSSKIVIVNRIQLPPLSQLGLRMFQELEHGNYSGITYKDTFFLVPKAERNESTYFHELVHIVQWDELTPESLLLVCALGLSQYGYRNSPLESMEYSFQEKFDRNETIDNLEKLIRLQTRNLFLKLSAEISGTEE